jgi:hypothetical protein
VLGLSVQIALAICLVRLRLLSWRIKAPDRTSLLGERVAPTEDNWVDKALLRLLPHTASLRSRLARSIAETDERVTLDGRAQRSSETLTMHFFVRISACLVQTCDGQTDSLSSVVSVALTPLSCALQPSLTQQFNATVSKH